MEVIFDQIDSENRDLNSKTWNLSLSLKFCYAEIYVSADLYLYVGADL